MSRDTLLAFLGGATTLAYVVAAFAFLRFWRRTGDRLFRSFTIAFLLLGLNQALTTLLGGDDERSRYIYILRVIGFLVILYAILRKNLAERKGP